MALEVFGDGLVGVQLGENFADEIAGLAGGRWRVALSGWTERGSDGAFEGLTGCRLVEFWDGFRVGSSGWLTDWPRDNLGADFEVRFEGILWSAVTSFESIVRDVLIPVICLAPLLGSLLPLHLGRCDRDRSRFE